MAISDPQDRGVLEAILGDGRFLLSLTGTALLISGGFAIAQSISGQLLPHDLHALGMGAARELNLQMFEPAQNEMLRRRGFVKMYFFAIEMANQIG